MARIKLEQPLIKSDVQVARSPVHRFGVFALCDFDENALIEECPVLTLDERPEPLSDLVFRDEGHLLLALGYGSVYNHRQENANAYFTYEPKLEVLRIIASQPIKAGEEIFIYYGKDWFSSRNETPVDPAELPAKPAGPKLTTRLSELFIFIVVLAVVIYLNF